LGFEAAVDWLVRQTKEQCPVLTEFEDDGKEKPLDDDVRILLFQAVRELLVNVVKHANAKRVKVSTKKIGDQIQITVEDDGIGLDVEALENHNYDSTGLGLFNIRERLGHIGGSLDIESTTGHGTYVTMKAPIDNKHKSKEKKV